MNDNFQVGHVGWSPDYNSNKHTIKLDRMLFIYALNGVIKCLSAKEIADSERMMLAAGWKHTATIDPARWIEAMANGHNEPSDMLDEIQFSPQNASAMSRELPPCDHDECPPTHCKQPGSFAAPAGSAIGGLEVWNVAAWGDVRECHDIATIMDEVREALELGCRTVSIERQGSPNS